MENNTSQDQYADEKELLGSYYNMLNPSLQNAITSEETLSAINAIADENDLTDEETDAFGNEVQLALLGFGNPINFTENLIQEGVRAEKASALASAAESKIFSQVKDVLKDLYTETPIAEPGPAVATPPPAPEPVPPSQTRAPEPFINTQNVRAETTHELDREALLRELESPEPYNVPFTPRKTSFEEKMNTPTPVLPVENTPEPKPSTQYIGHDPYREEPAS